MKINDREHGKQVFGEIFKKYCDKYRIFLLKGDLGSGKTFYISHIIGLYKPDEYVNSPTYTIMNSYDEKSPFFYHADLYRLDDMNDLLETGLVDMLGDEGFFLIEWPDRFMELFEKHNYILIDIKEGQAEEEREVQIIENTLY